MWFDFIHPSRSPFVSFLCFVCEYKYVPFSFLYLCSLSQWSVLYLCVCVCVCVCVCLCVCVCVSVLALIADPLASASGKTPVFLSRYRPDPSPRTHTHTHTHCHVLSVINAPWLYPAHNMIIELHNGSDSAAFTVLAVANFQRRKATLVLCLWIQLDLNPLNCACADFLCHISIHFHRKRQKTWSAHAGFRGLIYFLFFCIAFSIVLFPFKATQVEPNRIAETMTVFKQVVQTLSPSAVSFNVQQIITHTSP